jgi:uncharacterized GH25 family protein
MKLNILGIYLFFLVAVSSPAEAHDTWVQSGALVTRHQDVVHVDLMLGNHGNNHRDFKIASKITLAPCTLLAIEPNGNRIDLKPRIVDNGSAEKEGYWTTKLIAEQKGTYQVVHTLDTLHGKTRAIKTAKTFFISANCFTAVGGDDEQVLTPINKDLELVLHTPLAALSANQPFRLQVLWNGKPLGKASVAFIPRGAKLAEDRDPLFERTSDSEGFVSYTPTEGNLLLAVVHHLAPTESGEGFDKTSYGATMVLPIPQMAFRPDLAVRR